MAWSVAICEQLDFYWHHHLWHRLQGLGDEEYLWEPAPGAWTLRPDSHGEWQMDSLPIEPPVAPVTTIAWRMAHIGRDVLGTRAVALFGTARDTGEETSIDGREGASTDGREGASTPATMYDRVFWPDPLPRTAADALDMLRRAYGVWHDGIAALDDEALGQPIGPLGGPYAEQSMGELALHVNREVMAHGAEICLLRDLHRARQDAGDPVVSAALAGDTATLGRLLEGWLHGGRFLDNSAGSPSVRPSLVAEAAGLGHWEVVRFLVTAGADVNGTPGAPGSTPSALHYAAAFSDLEMVELLLASGADTTRLDPTYHLTPAGWADFFGRHDVAERLEQTT